MGIFKNLKNRYKMASAVEPNNVMSMIDVISRIRADFFTWRGNGCSPGFTIDLNNSSGLKQAYTKCPPLANIINRNAKAFANAKWWVTDEMDNDVKKRYPELTALMKSPNPLQSWTELLMQLDSYRQLYGEAFLWAVTPSGFEMDNKDAESLWAINPTFIDIKTSGLMFRQSELKQIVTGYFLSVGKEVSELPHNNILHIRDTYQNLNFNGTNVRGSSRIEGLHYPIRNIIQAYEAIYSLNKDRGAQGMLSNQQKDDAGTIPLTPEQKQELEDAFNKYGLSENQKKVIISSIPTTWQQMSFNVKDLMLFEGIADNIATIADALEYPFELLANGIGNGKGSNLSNGHNNEAKKRHYQDNIIPLANMYAEKLTEFFSLDEAHNLIADYSDVECLKEAEKEAALTKKLRAEAVKIEYQAGLISLEEARLELGKDEKVYGKTMYDGNKETTGQEGN